MKNYCRLYNILWVTNSPTVAGHKPLTKIIVWIGFPLWGPKSQLSDCPFFIGCKIKQNLVSFQAATTYCQMLSAISDTHQNKHRAIAACNRSSFSYSNKNEMQLNKFVYCATIAFIITNFTCKDFFFSALGCNQENPLKNSQLKTFSGSHYSDW